MSEPDTAEIAAIYRYPVKGLSAEPLAEIAVERDETLPFDRAYAIENGPGAFDRMAPRHLPKTAFAMLMRHERLAMLKTRFDAATAMLEIARSGVTVARGRLDEVTGRAIIEQFLAGFMKDQLSGPPRIVSSPGHSFSDVAMKCVSIINLASVRDIARVAGREIDPLRFRGNIYLDGLAPWAEFGWVGGAALTGDVKLSVVKRITRCAATNVDPQTGARDVNIPRLLSDAFGHVECGVYARIGGAGRLAGGQVIRLARSA